MIASMHVSWASVICAVIHLLSNSLPRTFTNSHEELIILEASPLPFITTSPLPLQFVCDRLKQGLSILEFCAVPKAASLVFPWQQHEDHTTICPDGFVSGPLN